MHAISADGRDNYGKLKKKRSWSRSAGNRYHTLVEGEGNC